MVGVLKVSIGSALPFVVGVSCEYNPGHDKGAVMLNQPSNFFLKAENKFFACFRASLPKITDLTGCQFLLTRRPIRT